MHTLPKHTSNNKILLSPSKTLFKRICSQWQLLLLLMPGLLFYLIFRYGPMYGIIIAFKDYGVFRGMLASPWVGFKYFEMFFNSGDFLMLFTNTLLLGFYTLIFSFPFPIMFAILLNEARNVYFKKIVQTASYLPSFLSVVVVSSMIIDMLSPGTGLINNLLNSLGFEKQYFMIMPNWFRTIYVSSGIWQHMGFESIIYIAALSSIDPCLYEAAKIDGCNRVKSIFHVTIPGLMPTVIVMFILNSGKLFKIGFEKVILLYNPATYSVADIFSSYVYRKGIIEVNYSYATAVGLFESIVALSIILSTNYLSKKYNERGLW